MTDAELLHALAGRMQQLSPSELAFVEKHALRGARLTPKGARFLRRIAARLDLVPIAADSGRGATGGGGFQFARCDGGRP